MRWDILEKVRAGASPAAYWLRRPPGWVVWPLIGLLVAAGVGVGIDQAFRSGEVRYPWPPKPCVVQGVAARCGTFLVPENWAKPTGRTLGLRVVVLPAWSRHARMDAVTYLAGGPGEAATQQAAVLSQELPLLRDERDILLVDQRGTGGSKPDNANVTQYGTRAAMNDLDAVRAGLGYRQLDVIGSSYGVTAAQIYARLHPSSVRTLILVAGTALNVPFFSRYAVNAQRALDQVASLCASEPDCRTAFPGWERQFGALVKAWNVHPVHGMTADKLASVIHAMLLDTNKAVSIPLVIARAARGDYTPLDHAGPGDLPWTIGLMSSIWCNEPWTGLDASGPWGTEFDSYTTAQIAAVRHQCDSVVKHAEPRSLWTLPASSPIPVLALVGGADPQDPVTNSSNVTQHFRDSRIVVFAHVGHDFSIGGCADVMMADFVAHATTKGLDTTLCSYAAAVVPPFPLTD